MESFPSLDIRYRIFVDVVVALWRTTWRSDQLSGTIPGADATIGSNTGIGPKDAICPMKKRRALDFASVVHIHLTSVISNTQRSRIE